MSTAKPASRSAPGPHRPLKAVLWSTSALGLADSGIRSLSALIVSPLLVRGLGPENYGLWVLVLAWVGWLEMLDLGMANTTARYLTSAISRSDDAEQRSLFALFRRHYRRMSLLVATLALLGTACIHWASFSDAPTQQAAQLFLVLGLLQALLMNLRVYPALLRGHLRYPTVLLSGSCRVIAFAIGLYALYPLHLDLNHLLALHASLLLLEQLFLFFQARRLKPQGSALPLSQDKQHEVLGFAGKNVAAVTAQLLRDRIDTQLLAAFLSLAAVAQYAVGVRLPLMALEVSNALFGGHLVAGFTAAANRKTPEELVEDLLKILRFSAWLALSGCVTLFLVGPAFILRWMGPEFGPAGEVLRVLTPGIALTAMQYPAFSVLPALNKHGSLALLYLGSSAVNLLVSIALVQWIGLTGVVWGTTVELVLQGLFGMPMLIARALPISRWRYLSRALLQPLSVYGLLLVPMVMGWVNTQQAQTYSAIALRAVTCGGVALLTGFVLVLKQEDRRFLWSRLPHQKQPT